MGGCRQSLLSLHMTKSLKDSHTLRIKNGSKSNTNSQLQSLNYLKRNRKYANNGRHFDCQHNRRKIFCPHKTL